MELDPSEIDHEGINAIFRSAHSIKGGSATFGFKDIAEFTHVLETLLDQVRSGKRGVTAEDINLFLQSVDCMREMLAMIQNQEPGATELSNSLKKQFEVLLAGEEAPDTSEKENKSQVNQETTTKKQSYLIDFTPGTEVLKTGNDLIRIFKALAELGAMRAELKLAQTPSLAEIDPENLYLGWHIYIETECSKEEILEPFEWILDESLLSIEVNSAQSNSKGIQVEFVPNADLFQSGNDPSKIFAQLKKESSTWNIKANVSKVPTLKLLDPEELHLAWDIEFPSEMAVELIRDAFEWVEDSASITIHEPAQVSEKSSAPQQAELNDIEEANASESAVTLSTSEFDPAAKAEPKSNTVKPKKAASSEASSIRVGIDKIDSLINMVGELVITQSMLGQLGSTFDESKTPKLIEGLSQLEQNTRELQESVMRIRMLPISFAFSRFPRMVRDLSQQLGKQINLEMLGEQTELDKTVMEKIGDPLVHLVRNAMDHGIETPDEREASGKKRAGKITLNAYHQSGNVVIEISDDGKGLDRDAILAKAVERGLVQEKDAHILPDDQVFDLIFQPGFSTAKIVSDVSGRGVGMDVVRKNIQALNGVVEISSRKGEGSTIRIRLPLTLAILDGQLVRVGCNTYIIPLVSIVESMQCKRELVSNIAGGCSVFKLRDDYVPIVRLSQVFNIEAEFHDIEHALLVVVESDGEKIGILVDELLAQQQVVIKSLEQNYRRVDGVSGATILGDGTVSLIIDIPGIVRLAGADSIGQLTSQNVILKKSVVQDIRKLA